MLRSWRRLSDWSGGSRNEVMAEPLSAGARLRREILGDTTKFLIASLVSNIALVIQAFLIARV